MRKKPEEEKKEKQKKECPSVGITCLMNKESERGQQKLSSQFLPSVGGLACIMKR